MSSSRTRTISILAFWAVLCLPMMVLAQGETKEAEADELLSSYVDVSIVNVDVYVTDRSGQRVTGLTQDDFEVLVDKKLVKTTNFYAVSDVAEVAAAEPGQVAPAVDRAALPAVASRSDQQLSLIIYVDNFNIRPFNRNRTFRAIRAFLRDEMRPGDQVMLVSYDRSLKVRHPFTRDPGLISGALYDLEEVTGHGVHFDSERREILEQIYEDAESMFDVRGRVTQFAESISLDVGFTLDALRQQVDSLAGIPGRKAILYVSDGLQLRPAEDLFWALNEKFQDSSVLVDAHRYEQSRNFERLIHQANANRVSFYTVDAAGLRTYSSMDARNRGIGGGPQIDQVYISNLQSTLQFMAEETGGFAIFNTNNPLERLGDLAADFGSYYSLGFASADADGGRYHKIKVELKGKQRGWKVRHREGFRAKPISVRMADTTLAALEYGVADNALGLQIATTGTAQRHDTGHYLVSLQVRIPMAEIAFLPQAEQHSARVQLYLAALDDEGGKAEVQELTVPIDIPNAEIENARSQYYQYEIQLLMRGGRQTVAIGARDEIGATAGFVTHSLNVGV